MRKLLRIDASSQTAKSHSRSLADYYEVRWRERHPTGKILSRDLVRDPIGHLDEETIAVFYAGGETPKERIPRGITISNMLIHELKEADDVVISSALYNFGMPSSLKAWIDHIVRFGHTITLGEKGVVGMLRGKQVCVLTSRGGTPERSPDYQYPVLQSALTYIGINKLNWISLEGTRIPDGELETRKREALAAIDDLFKQH